MIPERYASYEKVVTVGAVNFTPVPGDKASNLAKIEANVREAAAQGVELVVFPEEALVGCGGCDVCASGAAHCDYHDGLAETVPGPSTERIAELARELGIYVASASPNGTRPIPRCSTTRPRWSDPTASRGPIESSIWAHCPG